MIDLDSGTVRFEQPTVAMGPTLSRAAFLAAAWSRGAAALVANEPWHSWTLAGTYLSGGMAFAVALYFHGEELAMIDMAHVDPRFGSSWDDWSEAGELARKASHDAWLNRHVGPRRKFAWGEIDSAYDAKVGGSHLTMRYRAWDGSHNPAPPRRVP